MMKTLHKAIAALISVFRRPGFAPGNEVGIRLEISAGPNPNCEYLIHFIENVNRQKGSEDVVGDFVLTNKGLYYVPLQRIDFVRGLSRPAGAVGGLVGAFGVGLMERDLTAGVLGRAAKERLTSYGLPLDERCKQYQSMRLFVPREELCVVLRRSDGIFIGVRNGQNVTIPDSRETAETEKVFREYLLGMNHFNPIGNPRDKYGLGLPYIAPAKFLTSLDSGPVEGTAAINQATENEQWVHSAFFLLSEMKKKNCRKTCQKVRSIFGPISEALAGKASKEVRRGLTNKEAMWGYFFICVGIVLTVCALTGLITEGADSSKANNLKGPLFISTVFWALSLVILAANTIRPWRIRRWLTDRALPTQE